MSERKLELLWSIEVCIRFLQYTPDPNMEIKHVENGWMSV